MTSILNCSLQDLINESDVEQKFILPILISPKPLGLDYRESNFQTKPNIKALTIGKGSSAKLHYPDYIIINSGLPLVVIEAKRPGEDLKAAYREARLYCNEINSQFPHGFNPCSKIVVSNGDQTVAGYSDSDDSIIDFSFENVNAVSPNFYKFVEFISKNTVFNSCEELLKQNQSGAKFVRPLSMLGGKSVQNEHLNENSFGSTLSLDFRYLFNPESAEERKSVVLNAYVKTKRHLKQVDPIDKIIRSTLPLGLSDLKKIEDTSQPIEVVKALQKRMKLRNQLLLLIGSVGSGKSTFTDYLKDFALDRELKEETVWVSFNLNQAPLSRNEIYEWLKEQVILKLREQNTDIDFDDFSNLKKLYSNELNAFKKTYAPILGENTPDYQRKLADEIFSLKKNLDITSKAYTRYLCSERAKLFIIVLDNTDKRELSDQLLMFEVASWLKEHFNCLVFLPLRDTTFDNFRKQPPLDTVIKDFVFRIDPPLLKEVIFARIKYALREMAKGSSKLSFTLPNGIVVEYPASDQGYYLTSIVRSLFESTYFSRLISGLAGRDIRKGLEIFLDFCKSGHINEAEIIKIRFSKGQYILPNHLISRIILRGSMKYYIEDQSAVKNIFYCFKGDANPDPFARLVILSWLDENFKKTGPTKNIGYHKVFHVIRELMSRGHSEDRLILELEYLIRAKYVVTENQSTESFNSDDLISLSPSGITLLELINDPNYLSSCAEDLFYRDESVAQSIFERISERTGFSLYSIETTIANSKDLLDYLINYRSKYLLQNPQSFLDTNSKDYGDLSRPLEIINKRIDNNETLYLQNKYPHGTKVTAQVIAIKEYGVFVEFGLEQNGFLHISEFNYTDVDIDDLELGDEVVLSIKKYNSEHQRFEMEFRD